MMNEKFLVNHKFWRQVKKKTKKTQAVYWGNKYINQNLKYTQFIYLFL